jgi:hypothetical protein
MSPDFKHSVMIIVLLLMISIAGCSTVESAFSGRSLDVVSVEWDPANVQVSWHGAVSGSNSLTASNSYLRGTVVNRGSSTDPGYYYINGRIYDANGNLISVSWSMGASGERVYPGDSFQFSIPFCSGPDCVAIARSNPAKAEIFFDYYGGSNRLEKYTLNIPMTSQQIPQITSQQIPQITNSNEISTEGKCQIINRNGGVFELNAPRGSYWKILGPWGYFYQDWKPIEGIRSCVQTDTCRVSYTVYIRGPDGNEKTYQVSPSLSDCYAIVSYN